MSKEISSRMLLSSPLTQTRLLLVISTNTTISWRDWEIDGTIWFLVSKCSRSVTPHQPILIMLTNKSRILRIFGTWKKNGIRVTKPRLKISNSKTSTVKNLNNMLTILCTNWIVWVKSLILKNGEYLYQLNNLLTISKMYFLWLISSENPLSDLDIGLSLKVMLIVILKVKLSPLTKFLFKRISLDMLKQLTILARLPEKSTKLKVLLRK